MHCAQMQGAAPGAEEAGLLGDVDPASQGGFLLGTAPLNARPAAGSPTAAAGSPKAGGGGGNGSLRVAVAGAGAGAAAGVGRRSPPAAALSPEDSETASPRSFASGLEAPGGASGTGGGGPLDLNTLFVKWKGGPCEGQRLAAAVRERQQQLADLKRGVKVGCAAHARGVVLCLRLAYSSLSLSAADSALQQVTGTRLPPRPNTHGHGTTCARLHLRRTPRRASTPPK